MARIPFRDLGGAGIIKSTDVDVTELPLTAWTDAKNMRLRNNFIERVPGHSPIYQESLNQQPQYALFVPGETIYYWLFPGATNILRTDGTTMVDITPAGGETGRDGAWNGVVFGGYPILNNGVQPPLTFDTVNPTNPMIPLANWPTGATCKRFTAYREYLVAAAVTEVGAYNPRMIKWSCAAPSGSLPVTWDVTDPTHDAGEYSLNETSDSIIFMCAMGNINLIYKQNNIWGMQWVGGLPVFDFYAVFRNRGILANNCAVEFQTGLHAVFGDNDLYIHDGNTITSLVGGKMRDWIYKALDNQNFANSFVSLNSPYKEVWFCFPTAGNTLPNLALIWNYELNQIGFRDLPNAAYIGRGVADPGAVSGVWSAQTELWSQDVKAWNTLLYNPTQYRNIMCVPGVPKGTFLLDFTTQFNGVNPDTYCERIGIGLPTRDGGPPDMSSRKVVTRMWPRITGTPGSVVNISFGTMEAPMDVPHWLDTLPYVIGQVPAYVDPTVDVNLLCLRFEGKDGGLWRLSGYELEVAKSGSTGL